MKARITFVNHGDDSFNPSQLALSGTSLTVSDLHAVAREDHLTFGLEEIPKEIWQSALQHSHELHIRWQSSKPYPMSEPYGSRVAPGLHVFYTPTSLRETPSTSLCPLLQKLFSSDVKCTSPAESFVQSPVLSERFSSSSTHQYYQLVPDLESLAVYIDQKVCKGASSSSTCSQLVQAVRIADSLDVDYDAISHALTIRILRSESALGTGSWSERITSSPDTAIEVGVLSMQDSAPGADDSPSSLSMGGYLAVLGEDSRPSPTLFSFPSRHHTLSSTPYTVSFNTPTGLHPTLRISFPSGTPPPPNAHSVSSCALHAQLTLPSHTFPDKYQLSAPNFLAANNLRQIRALTSPSPDLEAPDWAVAAWGSNMLLELAPPRASAAKGQSAPRALEPWHADVPLHLRYLRPAEGGIREVETAWPTVFWACSAEEGTRMNVNPFDRTHLGYDGAFGVRTVFYHLAPRPVGNATLVERVRVPVLDVSAPGFGYLREGTAGVLLLGLVWVVWQLVAVVVVTTRRDAGGGSRKIEDTGGQGVADKKVQ